MLVLNLWLPVSVPLARQHDARAAQRHLQHQHAVVRRACRLLGAARRASVTTASIYTDRDVALLNLA